MVDVEQDYFNLTSNETEFTNSFAVVHLHNRNCVYHLTRRVLIDSELTQNKYSIFKHVITMNVNEFNNTYGSFACLLDRSVREADLYLNVDPEAIDHIIQYMQSGRISRKIVYEDNTKIINKIINLATMFGMPSLVSAMKNLLSSTDNKNDMIDIFSEISNLV